MAVLRVTQYSSFGPRSYISQPLGLFSVSNPCFGGDEPLRVNGRIVQCSLRSCPHTHHCHIGQNSRSTVCCKRKGNLVWEFPKGVQRSTVFCFQSLTQPASACLILNQISGNVCDQQLMVGVGDAKLPRWYYDSVEDTCARFNYSGLAGNENNFLTKEDCEITCPGNLLHICGRRN